MPGAQPPVALQREALRLRASLTRWSRGHRPSRSARAGRRVPEFMISDVLTVHYLRHRTTAAQDAIGRPWVRSQTQQRDLSQIQYRRPQLIGWTPTQAVSTMRTGACCGRLARAFIQGLSSCATGCVSGLQLGLAVASGARHERRRAKEREQEETGEEL
jgi:hypothetical protein